MSQRIREDLDLRIRRAWPIACDTTSSPPSEAQRMRTRIDERIVGGAEPDPSHMVAPARRTDTPRRRRRRAAVLAGAVLVTSVLVVSGLVAGRLRLQERPSQVEFADEPAPRVPEDPDAAVRDATAATRRALADLTVREVARSWINRERRRFADVDTFVEQTAPYVQSTSVDAANGDWAFQDRWNTQGSNTRLREPGGCAEIADCAAPFGAMRFVGGRYYERAYGARTWERVIADDGRELSELVRDGLAMEGITLLDGRTVVDLLERYDGGWTVVPSAAAGVTRYQTDDTGKAYRLATELREGKVLPRAAANDLDAITPEITTVHVWIDDESGLLQRVFVEQRSTRDVAKHTWLGRHDITLTYGDVSPVAAPEQATDVTFDQWCARDRNARWCG
jgi:hypothetical protein